MHKIKLLLFFNISIITSLLAQTQSDYHLLIGTYDNKEKNNGIHLYDFNTDSGTFRISQPVTRLANASYLAISHDRKNVYAVSGSNVNSFAFNPVTGKLNFINSVPSEGSCYVSVDTNKKVVFAGNYGGGSVLSIHLNEDGSFIENNVQTIQHTGSSVNKNRQEKPHVHSTMLSLDEHYLLVPDLGTDRVYQYRIDANKEEVLVAVNEPFLTVKPGGGPRHLAFHPNGKYVYLILELTGSVMALDYDNGKLKAKQTLSMVAPNFKGNLSGADIHVSPDGKFLYASNRGDANEIAIFSIDNMGKLTFVSRQSVLGKRPRNFVIDPTGKFLLAANQDTNEIIIFKRDLNTGLLVTTGEIIKVDNPVCLKFVPIEKSDDKKMIAEAIERFNVVMVEPDSSVLENLASDDLEYVHSSGTVRDKQGFIDEFMKRWTNFTKVSVLDQTIKISGDNAIVRHRLVANMNNPGYPSEVDIIILMVWRKEGGKWKMLARQAAKIPK